MMVIYRLIRADTKPFFLTMGSDSKRKDETMIII